MVDKLFSAVNVEKLPLIRSFYDLSIVKGDFLVRSDCLQDNSNLERSCSI